MATNFYGKFQELCNLKNVFPSTACKEMGLSPSAINRWKEGSIPNRSTLFRMAKYFSYDPDSFIQYAFDNAAPISVLKQVQNFQNNPLINSAANLHVQTNTVSQNPLNALLDALNDPVLTTYVRILNDCTPEQKKFLQDVIEKLTNAQHNCT